MSHQETMSHQVAQHRLVGTCIALRVGTYINCPCSGTGRAQRQQLPIESQSGMSLGDNGSDLIIY
eukprot:CAMPEP_0183340452 /NCGR_PEP_ID=MMETSP0164_2-20130417/7003_1 /TAXON_ID=221442 /ORGANISM="Coccolithus pelagicus ssp braarudi, Strain PLY182g" /LENGTH=64 /DNA_ID=CAMNT_0025510597 /DNA_START=379 /DNA_END=573 /DNA_ORIENTATION=+